MSRRVLDVLLGAYLAVCAWCLAGPGLMRFGARVEPLVLGLPFALFWSVVWIVATFAALCVYHALRERAER